MRTYSDYLSDSVKCRLYNRLLKDSKLSEQMNEIGKDIYEITKLIIQEFITPEQKKFWTNCKRIHKRQEKVTILYKELFPTATDWVYPQPGTPAEIPGYYPVDLNYTCYYNKNSDDDFPLLNPNGYSLGKLVDLSSVKQEYIDTLGNLLCKYAEISYNIETFLHEDKLGSASWNRKFINSVSTWGALKRKNLEWFNIACELCGISPDDFGIISSSKPKDLTEKDKTNDLIKKIKKSLNNNIVP